MGVDEFQTIKTPSKGSISSLYYERSGLSKNKKKLAELVKAGAESAESKIAIRDPYIFEFLELKPKEVMGEPALAGMDNALFVSRYQVELPKKEDMPRFMQETRKEVGDRK
ncbi:MAG: hypothetical protein Q8R76_00710 [Candidatus Omnitrophota bacterium]|nr:hypothetical protein [Candidatus Omnitrophota bacterium]